MEFKISGDSLGRGYVPLGRGYESVGVRIDVFLAENTDLTRSALQNLIANGNIQVNRRAISKNYKLRLGDEISVSLPEAKDTDIKAQDLNLDVLYEDEDVIVINKRQGMVVHPSQDNYEDTLVNALLHHCKGSLSGINGEIRPGIVHRLDKDTAGVMIAAKNDRAHIGLAEQIKEHSVERIYHTLVFGNIREDSFTIDKPLGRSVKDFKKVAVYSKANEEAGIKTAVTHIQVVGRYEYRRQTYSYVKARLETGRTHQIRVHLANLGHSVIGDKTYGLENVNSLFPYLEGQCLFSKSIRFVHPVKKEEIFIEADLPEFFTKTLDLFNG